MHPLVQFCTRVWLSSNGDTRYWERLFLRVMSDQYPPGTYENWAECQILDPHIEDLVVKKAPDEREEALQWG